MTRTLALLAAALMFAAAPDAGVAKPKGCPPGLAKKSPSCVPPGLAKKGVTAEERDRRDDADRDVVSRDYDDLRQGDRVVVNGEEYRVLRIGDRIILERDTGELYPLRGVSEDYGRVQDALVKVDQKARTVFTIIELGELLVN